MTTKQIFAEQLKKDNTIVIPETNFTTQRVFKVTTDPTLTDLIVNCFCVRVLKDKGFPQTPIQIQFGRKVNIDILDVS